MKREIDRRMVSCCESVSYAIKLIDARGTALKFTVDVANMLGGGGGTQTLLKPWVCYPSGACQPMKPITSL